jgi:glycosyltransferase involved in cell wall biosynthesis
MWRIWQPFAALQARGYPALWGWNQDPSLYISAGGADVIILPRLGWTKAQGRARDLYYQGLHRAGKCIVYEVDDDHFSWAFSQHIVTTQWKTKEQADEARDNIRAAMEAADGITVSTRRLATVVREHTDKPVAVVPNAIDLQWFRAVLALAQRNVPALTIGWSGARRPEQDFEPMLKAWGAVAKRHPNVHFVIQGYGPKALFEHVPEARVQMIPWLALEEYPIGFKSIDIGCCVLADNPFNRCKSDIKAQEYGAAGAAVVASPTVYGQTLRDGYDGLIAETAKEWTGALTRLLEDQWLRKHLAKTLRKRVERELCLDANLWRWPAAWNQIHEDFTRRRARASLILPPSFAALR